MKKTIYILIAILILAIVGVVVYFYQRPISEENILKSNNLPIQSKPFSFEDEKIKVEGVLETGGEGIVAKYNILNKTKQTLLVEDRIVRPNSPPDSQGKYHMTVPYFSHTQVNESQFVFDRSLLPDIISGIGYSSGIYSRKLEPSKTLEAELRAPNPVRTYWQPETEPKQKDFSEQESVNSVSIKFNYIYNFSEKDWNAEKYGTEELYIQNSEQIKNNKFQAKTTQVKIPIKLDKQISVYRYTGPSAIID